VAGPYQKKGSKSATEHGCGSAALIPDPQLAVYFLRQASSEPPSLSLVTTKNTFIALDGFRCAQCIMACILTHLLYIASIEGCLAHWKKPNGSKKFLADA